MPNAQSAGHVRFQNTLSKVPIDRDVATEKGRGTNLERRAETRDLSLSLFKRRLARAGEELRRRSEQPSSFVPARVLSLKFREKRKERPVGFKKEPVLSSRVTARDFSLRARPRP